MKSTPFPVTPKDVPPLSVQEFMLDVDLDLNDAPSLDVVCANFGDDTNRALIWFIRFRALRTWSARADVGQWLKGSSGRARKACEMAASFELNDDWEFDAVAFRSAAALPGPPTPG